MILITSFILKGNLEPVIKALRKTSENKLISRLCVVTEGDKAEIEQFCKKYFSKEVIVIQTGSRASFKLLFEIGSELIDKHQEGIAIANADVALDSDADIKKSLTILEKQKTALQKTVITLSRHEITDRGLSLELYDDAGFPNLLSVDCWVFDQKIEVSELDYISLGIMNCDQLLNLELVSAGIKIINPCLDVKLVHFEADTKDDKFYSEKNLEDISQRVIGHNWAKNANEPFKAFGAPWTREAWVRDAYNPSALDVSSQKKLLLALDDDSQIETVKVAEIYAKINGMHLVVLYEQAKLVSNSFIKELAGKPFTILPVKSFDGLEAGFLSNKSWLTNSVAFIKRFSSQASEVLKEYSCVYSRVSYLAENTVECPKLVEKLSVFYKARYGVEAEKLKFSKRKRVSLVSSIFKTDEFLEGFFKNITELTEYEIISDHIALVSKTSQLEINLLLKWWHKYTNAILLWKSEDPGLYESWNIGIRVAETEYISNANADDLRAKEHIFEIVDNLDKNPRVSVAATSILPFHEYTDDVDSISTDNPWYADQAGEFGFSSLGFLGNENGEFKINPHNLPHCMPVWRKSLHELYGYFDEPRYGTFADWAFWLKVTKYGELGYLNPKPLSFYYVNLESHNRRGDKLEAFHREVELEFLPDFIAREKQGFIPQRSMHAFANLKEVDQKRKNKEKADNSGERPQSVEKKLNLTGENQSFGQHRNSFNKLISALEPLHKGKDGIKFIPFIERYFVWGTDPGEAASDEPKPLSEPWIGILHVPFDAPTWFNYDVSPENIFETELWKESLQSCKGMIFLTKDIERDFNYFYPHIPTLSVKHPTSLDVKEFDIDAYLKSPRIVQVGDWLRKLQTIYQVQAPNHEKVILLKDYTRNYLENDKKVHGDFTNNSVTELSYVSNDDYDDFLSSSVVVCMMYANAANNVIIECIARSTPIVVNPLPSVVEYLGEDYPLYCEEVSEIETLLKDNAAVKKAYNYLKVLCKNNLSYSSYTEAIHQSSFYKYL